MRSYLPTKKQKLAISLYIYIYIYIKHNKIYEFLYRGGMNRLKMQLHKKTVTTLTFIKKKKPNYLPTPQRLKT